MQGAFEGPGGFEACGCRFIFLGRIVPDPDVSKHGPRPKIYCQRTPLPRVKFGACLTANPLNGTRGHCLGGKTRDVLDNVLLRRISCVKKHLAQPRVVCLGMNQVPCFFCQKPYKVYNSIMKPCSPLRPDLSESQKASRTPRSQNTILPFQTGGFSPNFK